MKGNIEVLLGMLSDTEEIEHNDKLSRLISSEAESELTEFDLDMVSAASKPDYEKFKNILKDELNE